jgi:hypothetical protein
VCPFKSTLIQSAHLRAHRRVPLFSPGAPTVPVTSGPCWEVPRDQSGRATDLARKTTHPLPLAPPPPHPDLSTQANHSVRTCAHLTRMRTCAHSEECAHAPTCVQIGYSVPGMNPSQSRLLAIRMRTCAHKERRQPFTPPPPRCQRSPLAVLNKAVSFFCLGTRFSCHQQKRAAHVASDIQGHSRGPSSTPTPPCRPLTWEEPTPVPSVSPRVTVPAPCECTVLPPSTNNPAALVTAPPPLCCTGLINQPLRRLQGAKPRRGGVG